MTRVPFRHRIGNNARVGVDGPKQIGCLQQKYRSGDAAAGTPRTRQIDDFPSITSIEGLSIIVITLNKAVR
jgi:hypothetical protein